MAGRPLLDLFCGAGGAGMGYHRAGFDVIGVDNQPQPHYPFEFKQRDALAYLEMYRDALPMYGHRFAAIHASPPCQDELAQAIPPAFTEYVGQQLIGELRRAA